MRLLNLPLIALLFLSFMSQSCTTLMDPDANVLKTRLKQLNPRPRIRPASKKDMLVYVRYRNSSGSEMDIRDHVMDEVRKSGYTITDDIDNANFLLNADLRYVGYKTHQSYGHTIFGVLIGTIAGAVIGNQVGGGKTGRAIGGAAGAVLGGITGKAIDNRNRIVTVDMVVDLSIGERIKDGVTTSRDSAKTSATNQSSRRFDNGSHESGRSSTSYNERTKFDQKEDFFYHENRFIASATKLKLTYGEAESALSGKISRAIANSLP